MWLTGLVLFVFGCRPTIGGKYCLGERKRFRSCNIDVSITALRHHHYHYHQLVNTPSFTWLNLFRVWSLHGTLLASVYCVYVCVRAHVCVCVTGVPSRLSGFQGDSVLWLWQRSFPGKILHLEALQRGWVSKCTLCVCVCVREFICSMVITTGLF